MFEMCFNYQTVCTITWPAADDPFVKEELMIGLGLTHLSLPRWP